MSAVKPLTVVTKVGRQKLRADGLGPHDDIRKRLDEGELVWEHEDCVTLADAERYAENRIAEALRMHGRVVPPENHGAFYLETQADLVLKARVEAIEKRLRGMGVMLP